MGPRAWMMILGIGVASVLALGFLTKFAIDSSPDLQAMIRFKVALAEDFGPRGVQEVSLQKLPRRDGFQLLVAGKTPQGVSERDVLDAELADYFARKFSIRTPGVLRIVYQAKGSPGCEAPAPERTVDVKMGPVYERIADEESRTRLGKNLLAGHGCRLVTQVREGTNLRIDVEWRGPPDRDLGDLARKIEPVVREEFRKRPYGLLHIRVWRPAGPESSKDAVPSAPALEVRFDPRGREARG